MSTVIYSNSDIADVSGSLHPIATGNFALTKCIIDLTYCTVTANSLNAVRLYLQSTSLGNFWQQLFYFQIAGGGGYTKPNLPGPYVVDWNDPLIIPRGDTIYIGSSNQVGITQVDYSVNLYGRILP